MQSTVPEESPSVPRPAAAPHWHVRKFRLETREADARHVRESAPVFVRRVIRVQRHRLARLLGAVG